MKIEEIRFMAHLVTSSFNMHSYPKAGSTEHGFLGQKKAIVIMEDGQFSQLGMRERIGKLMIYSPIEIRGITTTGETRIIHATWPLFNTQEQFKAYLTNAFLVITPISNGELQLRSSLRCLGGGQGPSKEKKAGSGHTNKQHKIAEQRQAERETRIRERLLQEKVDGEKKQVESKKQRINLEKERKERQEQTRILQVLQAEQQEKERRLQEDITWKNIVVPFV